MMTGAGTRCWSFRDPSHVRTHAQSRAELESSLARKPYMAGCEISPATRLRTDALQSKWTDSPAAYGYRPRKPEPGVRTSRTKSAAPCTDWVLHFGATRHHTIGHSENQSASTDQCSPCRCCVPEHSQARHCQPHATGYIVYHHLITEKATVATLNEIESTTTCRSNIDTNCTTCAQPIDTSDCLPLNSLATRGTEPPCQT